MSDAAGNELFMVFSNPVAGREDEYNHWYDTVHLADVQNVPGVSGAQRFELVPAGGEHAPAPAHRYLAVYNLDGEPADVLSELKARAGGPQMAMSAALDLTTISMTVWKPRS
jgi:hypothetical protein